MSIRRIPSIYVAYGWNNGERWTFLRNEVREVYASVDKELQKTGTALKGRVSGPNRLRAGAGRPLLETIQARLTARTILIADLSHESDRTVTPNVLFEIGVAYARGARIFLVGEGADEPATFAKLIPSDLQGWFLSTYTRRDDGFHFGSSKRSFRMQLRGALLDLVRLSETTGSDAAPTVPDLDDLEFAD